MGRPPKPTHLKVVSGTLRKHRQNPAEPKPKKSRLSAPSHLPKRAKAAWTKAHKLLTDMGVLTSADGAALEALCLAISDEWEARDSLARSITYQKLVDDTDESGKKTSRLEEHTIAEGGSQTYVTIGKSGPMVRMRPEVAAIADANRRVAMWLARFGLTPADRSRVGAAEEKKENPFADLG